MLREYAAPYVSDVRTLWELTAYETEELIRAGRKREAARARENELLAYNIGALVMTAFNAPSKYPRSPDAAFGRKHSPASDGGKADFMSIAKQLNRRFADRGNVNDS